MKSLPAASQLAPSIVPLVQDQPVTAAPDEFDTPRIAIADSIPKLTPVGIEII